MNCKLSDEYMMKYFDRQLNDIELAQMKQHLKTCKRCGEGFGELDGIVSLLETESMVEPPEDFEIQVMNKINSYENSRRRSTSKLLVFLYNFTTAVAVALLLIFVVQLKEVDIRIGQYFTSFSGFTEGLYSFATEAFGIVSGVVRAFVQVAVILIRNYYYILITLAALLLAVQKTFFILVKQDGGDKK